MPSHRDETLNAREREPDYQHQQPGTLIRTVLVLCIAGACGIGGSVAWSSGAIAVLSTGLIVAVLLLLLALFHALTVRVSSETIDIAFGVGLVRKRFCVADVESAEIVRTHWYNGWGIRYIPGGWLFNVSGFDAVEIMHRNGKRYRIGTNQPEALHAAIASSMVTN